MVRNNILNKLFILIIALLVITKSAYSVENDTNNIHFISDYIDINNGLKDDIISGINARDENNYNLAYNIFISVDKIAAENDSNRIRTLALNNLGILFYYLNVNDSAVQYYFKALDLAKKYNYLDLLITINNNIGIIYSRAEDYNLAIDYFKKAYEASKISGDTLKMGINLTNIALSKVNIGEHLMAEKDFNLAIDYLSYYDYLPGLIRAYNGLGRLYYIQDNYSKSINYYQNAIKFAKKINQNVDRELFYSNIAKSYFELDIEIALNYLDTAYDFSRVNKNIFAMIDIIEFKSEAYNRKSEYKESQKLLLIANHLLDSLNSKNMNNQINNNIQLVNFEAKKREYDLLKEKTEIKSKLNSFIYIALIVLVISIIVIARMRIKSIEMTKKLLKLENEETQSKFIKERSKAENLEKKVDQINVKLMSKELLIENKNQILSSIGSLIDNNKIDDGKGKEYLLNLKQQLNQDNLVDKNIDNFNLYFEKVHADFFKNLLNAHPNLTVNDLRLSAYLILQFNNKEIADIINISNESVRKRKQRLKEKLEISNIKDLIPYLYKFAEAL